MIRLQKKVIFICNSKREFRFFLAKKLILPKKIVNKLKKLLMFHFCNVKAMTWDNKQFVYNALTTVFKYLIQ